MAFTTASPWAIGDSTTKTKLDVTHANTVALKDEDITMAGVKTFSSISPGVNFVQGYRTQALSATPLVLVVGDAFTQVFTGTVQPQIVTLPATNTITTGHRYEIINRGTGILGYVTVRASGGAGNEICVLPGNNSIATFTCIATANAGTAAEWLLEYLTPKTAVIVHDETSGTSGGQITPVNTFKTRKITSVLSDPSAMVSLASNQITLPAGTYVFSGSMVYYNTYHTLIRLYNITASAASIMGPTGRAADNSSLILSLYGIVTVTVTTIFELQHEVSNTLGTNDAGISTSVPNPNERYMQMLITKIQ